MNIDVMMHDVLQDTFARVVAILDKVVAGTAITGTETDILGSYADALRRGNNTEHPMFAGTPGQAADLTLPSLDDVMTQTDALTEEMGDPKVTEDS
jgi:hypothetical protein